MSQQLIALIVALRPRSWVKNLALFAPLVFTGGLFHTNSLGNTTLGFIGFCFLSSSSYILNDVFDKSADLTHPFKRARPIARGVISVSAATTFGILLAIGGLTISHQVGGIFFALALIYLLNRYLNTLVLRHIGVIDILTIAMGYLLRVYAGVVASGAHMSIWLAIAIASLALLLGIGKRRAEFTLLKNKSVDGIGETKHLVAYSEKLLDTYVAMFATATFITYAYYTFLANFSQSGFLAGSVLTDVPGRKWLMVTIPFILYGIMRYLQLIYEPKKGTMETIITTDKPLIATGVLWLLTVFIVTYGIGR